MYSVKKLVKAMNKQKRKDRARNLAIASAIGATSGAIMALFIAPKSDSINNSLNQIKEKVVDSAVIGKEKVYDLSKKGRNMFKKRKKDIKEIKGKLEDKFEDSKIDIVEGIDKHYDSKNKIAQ
jgi:gas vesicle protein